MDQWVRKPLSNMMHNENDAAHINQVYTKHRLVSNWTSIYLQVIQAHFFKMFRKMYLVKSVSTYSLLISELWGTGKLFLNTVMVQIIFCPKYTLKPGPVAQDENSKPVPILVKINASERFKISTIVFCISIVITIIYFNI